MKKLYILLLLLVFFGYGSGVKAQTGSISLYSVSSEMLYRYKITGNTSYALLGWYPEFTKTNCVGSWYSVATVEISALFYK